MLRPIILSSLLLVACSETARHPPPVVSPPMETNVVDAGADDTGAPLEEPFDAGVPPSGPDSAPDSSGLETTTPVAPVKADLVVVESAENVLVLYRDEEELARYPVAIGRGGVGKRRHGDEKTPRGRYRLLDPSSSRRFHHFILVTYPNIRDVRRGLNRGLITKAEHDELARILSRGALPPQNSKLGGNIGIHAPEAKQGEPRPPPDPSPPPLRKTGGCIVMNDVDLEDFLERFEPGTIIEIR